ncbi:MAG: flagellar biosynthetic protein FliO [Silvanigrellaceae bacterium]
MTCNQTFHGMKTRLLKGIAVTGACSSFLSHASPVDMHASREARLVAQVSTSIGTGDKLQQATVPPIPASDATSNAPTVDAKSARNDMQSATDTGAANGLLIQQGQPAKEGTASQNTTDPRGQQTNSSGTDSSTAALSGVQNSVSQVSASEAKANSQTNDGKTSPEKGTPSDTPATLVPNGAALQSQLMPLGQADKTPWSTLAAGGLLILGIAALGILAVRLKQGKVSFSSRGEKQLQLVTSMALSPKRQIVLVRIRDKEVALASTEHGITLLTEMAAPQRQASLLEDGGEDTPKRRKVQQRVATEDSVRLVASSSEKEESAGQETAIARSEMLMGALKNLREKNLRNKSSITTESPTTPAVTSNESQRDRKSEDSLESTKSKGESTMKQTRAAFPKYVANAFEQESKRVLPATQSQNAGSQDEAGNVTNMIRERLKELRPLA